jgi:hypothetical protein
VQAIHGVAARHQHHGTRQVVEGQAGLLVLDDEDVACRKIQRGQFTEWRMEIAQATDMPCDFRCRTPAATA